MDPRISVVFGGVHIWQRSIIHLCAMDGLFICELNSKCKQSRETSDDILWILVDCLSERGQFINELNRQSARVS